MQAFGYAPTVAPIDQRQLQRLLKAFAARSTRYTDEQLTRLVYGYSKLASKRGLAMQRFLDFAASEVAERTKLAGWRKLRILQAVDPVPGVGNDFKSMLAAQIIKDVDNLDAERWHSFVPLLVEHGIHQREGVRRKLMKCFKQKVNRYTSPDLILRMGMPMVLYDLLSRTEIAIWLSRLQVLQLPITPAMASRAASVSALHGQSTPRHPRSRSSGKRRRRRRALEAEDVDDDDIFGEEVELDKDNGLGGVGGGGNEASLDGGLEGDIFGEAAEDLLSDQHRAATNLEAMKLVEMCLRIERPEIYETMSTKQQHLLTVARRTPLELPEDHEMLELPFVFSGLGRMFRSLGVILHPTIHGSFLLELADPLGHVVVEWDANWELYPPWRRKQHKDYVRRKHLYLRAEGWEVLCVPLAEFHSASGSAAEDRSAKLERLQRFIQEHPSLERLQLRSGDGGAPL